MDFEELKEFLSSRMKLSHIYQPLLIKTLIESGGSATIRQLAGTFLSYDESQKILYYEKRLKEMPIRMLKNQGIITRNQNLITLNVERLTLQQKSEIRKIYEARIHDYVASRGLAVWDYRLLDDSPVPDSPR
jgi:ATP adenylyltransferase